jgi:endo-1,4-beta-D-glucanase Y
LFQNETDLRLFVIFVFVRIIVRVFMKNFVFVFLSLWLFSCAESDPSVVSAPLSSSAIVSSAGVSVVNSSASVELEVESNPHFLPLGSTQLRITHPYHDILEATWNGIKKRSVDAYSVPLVHRPFSEIPGDAVSEGVGYGMILALYTNDQEYFNKIWDAGEAYLLSDFGEKSRYNWRADESGAVIGGGPASDADEDIACMLIFAQHLVNLGVWSEYTSTAGAQYGERAQLMLNSIWDDMISDGRYFLPGIWGGADLLNPGYFAPAFYRIFAAFDENSTHDWMSVIEQSYLTIAANPGASLGLLPDWSSGDGSLLIDGPGYNAFDSGNSMYKDGIRVYWRLATDYLWFGEERARSFLEKAIVFLESRGGVEQANFYDMNGTPVSADSLFVFDGGNRSRPRFEHSHLTVGMWAAAAIGSGDLGKAAEYSEELLSFYEGADYWGHMVDPLGGVEDIAHNEMYFDQFLAWFGASLLSGVYVNILAAQF